MTAIRHTDVSVHFLVLVLSSTALVSLHVVMMARGLVLVGVARDRDVRLVVHELGRLMVGFFTVTVGASIHIVDRNVVCVSLNVLRSLLLTINRLHGLFEIAKDLLCSRRGGGGLLHGGWPDPLLSHVHGRGEHLP